MWGIPAEILPTHSTAEHEGNGDSSSWSEDVQHDFIALELLPVLLKRLMTFFYNLNLTRKNNKL